MVTKSSPSIDLNAMFADVADQFSGLSMEEPGQWPWLPQVLVSIAVFGAVLAAMWYFVLTDTHIELGHERSKEPVLQADFRSKVAQAVNLEELRKQKLQVEEYVTQLEKQLPGKAEMDALLTDINQAGVGRGLQFESFKPGDFVLRDYYGEKLIAIKVVGRYHDLGAFAADIANLSRIVTLHNIGVAAPPNSGAVAGTGTLVMEATARAYRYLDESEIEQNRQSKAAAAGVPK